MLDWYDLNARQEAIFLWGASFLLFVFIRSPDFRKSLWQILVTLTNPLILRSLSGLLLTTALFTTVAVYAGKPLGFWDTLPVFLTITWVATSGIALLMKIDKPLRGEGLFRERALAILGPAVVIAELANLSIFPLWLEVLTLPLVAFLGILVAVADSKKELHGLKLFSVSLLALYIIVLATLTVKGVVDGSGNWELVAQHFLLPVWLTVGALVYLYLLVIITRQRFTYHRKSKWVRKEEYGSSWPLTVDSARLCYRMGAVWVEVNGKNYGINGLAKGVLSRHGHTCYDLEEIWEDNPEREKLKDIIGNTDELGSWKISIGPLIQDGLALEQCP